MLRLEIDQTFARIGVRTHPSRLNLSHLPIQMEMTKKLAEVAIDTEQPAVVLDLSKPFADMGLKKPSRLTQEWAEKGMVNSMQYIAAQAQDGDALGRIEDGVRVADVSSRRAWPHDDRQLNIGVIPRNLLRLKVEGGVKVTPRRGEMDVHVTPGTVEGEYRRGSIRTELAVQPKIEVRTVGNRFTALA